MEGAERLSIRGESLIAARGSSLLIHPGEPHSNATLDGARMGYRVFYMPAELVSAWMRAPRFREPVSRSPRLFRAIVAAHRLLCGRADALEQQSGFLSLLAELGDDAEFDRTGSCDPGTRLRRAKLYLDEHFRENPSLAELGEAVGLSPFHLLRSFRRAFGLSPAAYRNLLRVMEARRRLLGGEPIAEVAAEVGFVDQSHLTRQFQRVMGTTPARYAQQ